MRWIAASAALLSCLSVVTSTPLAAQIDYRNLDDDRPVTTEDAYPVEHGAFEFLLPISYERGRAGGQEYVMTPELTYGFIRNGQVGVKLPLAAVGGSADYRWGLSGPRVFGLYNVNTEGKVIPAVSARVDVLVPIGTLAGQTTRISLKAIATRGWGSTRVHANAIWTLGREIDPVAVDPGFRTSYSVALDRTLFRQSTLLIAELAAQRPVDGAPVQVNAAIGARYQWTPTTVLDLGVRRGLRRSAGPSLGVTLGFSHAFGFPWLMPGSRQHD